MSSMLLALVALASRKTNGDSNVSVFAAASLKDAFTVIARKYEASHPGLHVDLTFAGSQTLASQINQGAPADVFASASLKNLEGAKCDPTSIRIFAFNRLTIVERAGWSGIRSLKDLASVPKLVLAADPVPAGHYAKEFFDHASATYGAGWLSQVESHVVSRELDVRAVLAKVKLGEADAGIVYESDAISAKGQINQFEIPEALNPVAKYPVGLFPSSANAKAGKDFLKYLFTPEAQSELLNQGFGSPLAAPKFLEVISPRGTRFIKVPLPLGLHQVTLHLVGMNGVKQTVKGVSVSSALGPLQSTVTFFASDGYSKTFQRSDLSPDRAALVRESDGNYQVVVKDLKPSWWVKWIRRIEMK